MLFDLLEVNNNLSAVLFPTLYSEQKYVIIFNLLDFLPAKTPALPDFNKPMLKSHHI